jgi:hypothetical protein
MGSAYQTGAGIYVGSGSCPEGPNRRKSSLTELIEALRGRVRAQRIATGDFFA